MADLPQYDDLPGGASWGLWGEGDVFGCLNLLTADRVLAGRDCIRKGAVFALNLDMELPAPTLYGRGEFVHEVLTHGGGSHDDLLSGWNTQSSSQWDGFRHIPHPERGFYNAVADEDHGVHFWARRGIAGRAVLIDVARMRAEEGNPLHGDATGEITVDDLERTLAVQGTTVEPGDILLVRTGWLEWYRGLDRGGRDRCAERLRAPGLQSTEQMARRLWDWHIAAVAADNPALEAWPPAAPEHFLHFRLLPLLGLPIGELFDLDALAADCAADGVYESFFTSAPLNLQAGVASPPNALAIK
mgnify:CR=1 FL=1